MTQTPPRPPIISPAPLGTEGVKPLVRQLRMARIIGVSIRHTPIGAAAIADIIEAQARSIDLLHERNAERRSSFTAGYALGWLTAVLGTMVAIAAGGLGGLSG